MRFLRFLSPGGILALILAALPHTASAHEVYVLTSKEIAQGLTMRPFDMLAVARADLGSFFFWAFIAALTVFIVFFVSLIRPLERYFAPLFRRLRPYAPAVARITIGISFLAAAYYQATFGPELPLSNFGALAPFFTALLVVLGVCLTLGIFLRLAALLALALFLLNVYYHGIYMLTYANYFGEILVLVLLGLHGASARRARSWWGRLTRWFQPYSFLVLRVCFGVSLLYASLYAKVFHNDLALQVAQLPLAGHPFGLAHYFHLEPHFLVLGAAIVEVVIACFFILGIEIRFTALFLEFWLALSLWYFGEVVWPHLVLIGIPLAFLCYGYDRYSLEGRFFKHGSREPVL